MSLERIEVTPFPHLLGDIVTGRKSGALTVVGRSIRRVFHFAGGELALISSNSIHESLGAYLFHKGLLGESEALQLTPADWTDTVPLFHEGNIVHLERKHSLLHDWLLWLALPLFSWTEGTAAFREGDPLPPHKRAFMKSTPAFLLEGVRSIENGLVLRRCLGDVERRIEPNRSPLFPLTSLPLTAEELAIASALESSESIDSFVRRIPGNSADIGRVLIVVLALGIFKDFEETPSREFVDDHDTQGDLMLMAAIGSDPRALKAVGIARNLPNMSHYQVLEVPAGATRTEVMKRATELLGRFDPKDFPPIVRDSVEAIRKRIAEASGQLGDPARRQEYDSLLARLDKTQNHQTIQQRLTRRTISEQNYQRAARLVARGDHYGAIVLLRQAVDFAPDFAEAWALLGTCQQRNPQWHHLASESLQKALAIDPNHIEALLSIGDLYRQQGLESRAESCYEDVLQIQENNAQALRRLGRKPSAPPEQK